MLTLDFIINVPKRQNLPNSGSVWGLTNFRVYLYRKKLMKKILLILLICIYASATFGIGVKSFYCCDKLKSVTVAFSAENKENCNNDNTKHSCCKIKFHFFKLTDNYVATGEIESPVNYFAAVHSLLPSLQILSFGPRQLAVSNHSNAPPLHGGTPLYIFNCLYRI